MPKFNKVKHGKREGYLFQCPGCKTSHIILTDKGTPQWKFNGDIDKPTVSPSVLVKWHDRSGKLDIENLCHSFIKDGKIQFLNDCTHGLKGQTVNIPEWK